ncbi:MAG: sensor histidine kinase [Pseudomonadota bacterium]
MTSMLFGSLRSKITLGYVALGALFIGLTVFAFARLEAIERQVAKQRAISAFLDTVRDVRNLEKSLFQYRKQADYKESMRQLANGISLLGAYRPEFQELAPPERIQGLQNKLENHGRLLTEFWQLVRTKPAQAKDMEEPIRESRADFFVDAEDLSRNADRALADELRRYRWSLIASVAAVALVVLAAGHLLARRIAKPLKEMERSMVAIANGQLRQLEFRTADKEIASLSAAFNHMLEELQARQRDMVRSEKLASLGTMLSGVAHELNNPLSNISTSTQILLEELEQPNAAYQKELLVQIDDQTERARRIVSTLLEFARDRAFRRERVSLREMLEETLRLFGGQLPGSIAIRLEVPESLVMHADKQRMQQVFLNLIKNAVEASPSGGEVCVRAAPFGPYEKPDEFTNAMHERFAGLCEGVAGVDIEISDQGQGIAQDVLPRIFDPFFSTKDVGKGVGLGLFVVHEIITEHGGCITADSAAGEGTRFFIRLPDPNIVPVKQREAA